MINPARGCVSDTFQVGKGPTHYTGDGRQLSWLVRSVGQWEWEDYSGKKKQQQWYHHPSQCFTVDIAHMQHSSAHLALHVIWCRKKKLIQILAQLGLQLASGCPQSFNQPKHKKTKLEVTDCNMLHLPTSVNTISLDFHHNDAISSEGDKKKWPNFQEMNRTNIDIINFFYFLSFKKRTHSRWARQMCPCRHWK